MDGLSERLEIGQHEKPAASARRPRIVIIGAGFGGLSAAVRLGRADADVTVIDRRNYHLFQPLLYQVATAALSPADIAAPIRGILSRQANTDVILGAVTGIDTAGRAVLLGERRIPYDQLVIATGAREAYFGHDEWTAVTSGLKNIEDATVMRRRILLAFERAEDSEDETERRRLLTFVVIGGGPTGVELAGALAELAKAALARDFRHIDPTTARIVLVEAGPRLLPSFPPRLSEVAARALTRLGVELRLSVGVTSCDAAGAVLGDERIESRTLIWAAGVTASPAATWLGLQPTRGGRVPVGSALEGSVSCAWMRRITSAMRRQIAAAPACPSFDRFRARNSAAHTAALPCFLMTIRAACSISVSLGISAFSQNSLNIACVFKVYFPFSTLRRTGAVNVALTRFRFLSTRRLGQREGDMRLIMRLLRDESGDMGTELGLAAAIFSVGAVAVLQLVGVLHTP
jgi:NADH dehydrogenase FAD-containing subunit